MMAVDPPPPLHILANPYLPLLSFKAVIKLCTILAPLTPIGWPIATAPPKMFTFSLGMFSFCITTMGTIENA